MLCLKYHIIISFYSEYYFGNNRFNYEKTHTCGHYAVSEYLGKYYLPLNQLSFWITQCELEIRIWSLTIFTGCCTSQSKKCPSGVCHLSDVTLYGLLLNPERCFSFIGNLHLALYQTLIFTSVPNTWNRSKTWNA